MDDILIADNDRGRLKEIVSRLEQTASSQLQLTLKPPIFKPSKEGQVFLGYRVLPYRYELSGRSKKAIEANSSHTTRTSGKADGTKKPIKSTSCH